MLLLRALDNSPKLSCINSTDRDYDRHNSAIDTSKQRPIEPVVWLVFIETIVAYLSRVCMALRKPKEGFISIN